MLHVSLTRYGVVRGTNRELVEAAADLLATEWLIEAAVIDLTDIPAELAA
jgi:hypothetical protein